MISRLRNSSDMPKLSRNAMIGYPCGIITGIAYGLNPLFAKPLINAVLLALGLATTLVFLFPVLVAIIMVFLKVVPSWPVWLSIAVTFAGVVIMTGGTGEECANPVGVWLAIASAFVYALFIVIINRSKRISTISNSLLTFYALSVGAAVFFTNRG